MEKLKHPMMICKKKSIPVEGDIEMVVSCKIEFEFPRDRTMGFCSLYYPEQGQIFPDA
jgi:hypothetical protein